MPRYYVIEKTRKAIVKECDTEEEAKEYAKKYSKNGFNRYIIAKEIGETFPIVDAGFKPIE